MRGGPGDFAPRENRARTLAAAEPATREPLEFLAAVYAHQAERARDPKVHELAQELAGVPALEVGWIDLDDEMARARFQLAPLAPQPADDEVWRRVAATPIIELAAAQLTLPAREVWGRRQCPHCRGEAQVSVIDEESGEFLQGSPRFLVCGRCAIWWAFARAVCPRCGEHDPKHLTNFRNDRWPNARIDTCQTCSGYIKTFDLREPGSVGVIPLVDDVATIALDLWQTSRSATVLAT